MVELTEFEKRAGEQLEEEREAAVPSLFGPVHVPTPWVPKPFVPKAPTQERLIAMRNALAVDVAQIVGLIPVVGDIVADIVEDTHMAEVHDYLTAEEREAFMRHDKAMPLTSIALNMAFADVDGLRGGR